MYASVSYAAFVPKEEAANSEKAQKGNESALNPAYNYESFLSLSPKAYRELTGKKLTLKESFSLKMTQKMLRKQHNNAAAEGGTLPQWAYIVLSIFALGWLAIGIKSNWKGNDWWISLLLYFLFYFPGLIYSLIVMKKYY
jgi:uncharacterized membrane protein YqaE (UPF0057 family)